MDALKLQSHLYKKWKEVYQMLPLYSLALHSQVIHLALSLPLSLPLLSLPPQLTACKLLQMEVYPANEKYQELLYFVKWRPKILCNDEPDLVKMAAGVEAMEKLKILDYLLAGNGF
ncbi:Uncharacterized protein Adt_01739 [Abeliophyllum distichum]|uniref:Uncharacterized protein n=1 Tax=Abeliophyllum distichum TaxID=126358 RepID=A0ABD1VTU0_9LAMI